jgi:hypothetical protein
MLSVRVAARNALGLSDWSEPACIDCGSTSDMAHIDVATIDLGPAIGEGGFSVVHRGTYRGTLVAIKKLKVSGLEEAAAADAFRAEVALLAQLRHRNIVRFIGASLQVPDLCVLTELAQCSLSDLLYNKADGAAAPGGARCGAPLRPEQMLGFAEDIAKGCKYLHSLRPMIIHRDLKSSNLLVDSAGVCKISDFGLSRIKNESATQISGMLGTPGWSAPEIYKQDKYTERVDMYSYGVVLSELVTGERPYQGLNQMQIAFATVYQGQRPALPDALPKPLRALIRACWDSVPAKRPAWPKILQALRLLRELPWAQDASRLSARARARPGGGARRAGARRAGAEREKTARRADGSNSANGSNVRRAGSTPGGARGAAAGGGAPSVAGDGAGGAADGAERAAAGGGRRVPSRLRMYSEVPRGSGGGGASPVTRCIVLSPGRARWAGAGADAAGGPETGPVEPWGTRGPRRSGQESRAESPAPAPERVPRAPQRLSPVERRPASALVPPPPLPPSLPYKVDASRPSLRTNWTRLVPFPQAVGVQDPLGAPPPGGGALAEQPVALGAAAGSLEA